MQLEPRMKGRAEGGWRRRPAGPGTLSRTLVLWGCVFALAAAAQRTATTRLNDFRVPEYYDPPNETQMKTLLEGAQAEPESDGRIRITTLKLQTFSEKGEPLMQVDAPQCVFDSVQRAVSSPGPLSVRTADGQFHLEGEGFLWQQTNSWLRISNRVHTVIQAVPQKKPNS